MRKQIITLVTLAVGMAANAIVVDNTAGSLETNITSHDITSLTVTGSIDARDFKFIADSLTSLTELDLSQAQIVAYSNPTKALVGTIFDYPADELPAAVLMGNEMSTITLPSGLKSIGQAALAGCRNLTSLSIPDGVTTIGSYAFSGSGLTAAQLPASVTTVGEGAWARCESLSSASLNVAEVPAHAFMGDTVLSLVVLGDKVTTLGKSAFNGCTSLSTIQLDGDNNIRSIGTEAFIGASAQAIDLSTFTQLDSIGSWAFASSDITSANMPSGVSALGNGTFYYAESLEQATLPHSAVTVPAFTFAGNTALKDEFIVHEGVESIGDYAFFNSDQVSVFTIPASVNYMGNWAMAGMTGLDTINAVPTTVPALGDSVWAGVMQNAVMLNTADNDVADLYAAVDQWKEFHILRNYYLGDVNTDGIIDILDINMMCAYVLGQEVNPFDLDAADIFPDGNIDILDINTLVSFVLNGEAPYIRKAPSKRNLNEGNTTVDGLALNDIDINAGETKTVEIALNNSRQYSSLQFDIDMPEGLEIASVKATTRDKKHNVMLSTQGNRILVFSSSVDAISGNEGAIITMQVKANEAVQGTVEINNLVLVTPDHNRYVGSGSYAQVGGTTGVNDLDANSDKVYAYGNAIIIETQNAGVAQVVAMNGTAQDINVAAGRTEVNMPTGFYVVCLDGKSYKVSVK